MLNYTLSIFDSILFETAFISSYHHCPYLCKLDAGFHRDVSIERFIVPLSKKKRNERLEFNYFAHCIPMACEKANEVHGATRFNSRQLHKVPRFCTIYLQLFYGISLIATLHDL